MKARKFYRQVITYEILSEEPIPDMTLEEIAYETSEGHMSGAFLKSKETTHTGRQMAKLLLKQGSDPGFFQLTDTGKDTEDFEN